MAFGSSSAKPVFVRRTGIGAAKVVAVNPTMKQINDAFGRELFTQEQQYVRDVEYDGKKFKSVDVTFLLKFDPEIKENNGYSDLHFLTFRLQNRVLANSDENNPKVQVIDEYGRTAWVTTKEYENREIPVYKNGPARISKNYRGCYRGEENLIKFIAALRCVPDIDVWNKTTQKWEINSREEPDNCKKEITIEDLKKIFAGDFSPVRSWIEGYENSIVKVLLGVRTGEDGRKYSVIYDGAFLNQYQRSTTQLTRALSEDVARGRYGDTVFKIGPLVDCESVVPDDLSKPVSTSVASKSDFDPLDDLPFS